MVLGPMPSEDRVKRDTSLHVPTAVQRQLVAALAGFGITHNAIAAHIGICRNTLEKHYAADLENAQELANARVAQSLFQMATSGKVPAAAIFWMKARAKWREQDPPEFSTTGGATYVLSIERGPRSTFDIDHDSAPQARQSDDDE